MEHNYLTAREIKEATDEYLKNIDEIALDEIYDKIAAQVRLGSYELIINERLSEANKKFLENKGFEIYEGPSYCCAGVNNTYYITRTTISWRNG